MRTQLKNQKGFTLVELILVITILGILAVAALPQFIDVTSKAGDAAMEGVVGAVREGINLQRAKNMANDSAPIIPASLEGTDTTTLFDVVITNGITDTRWALDTDGKTYTYTPTGGGSATSYVYDKDNGTFQPPAATP